MDSTVTEVMNSPRLALIFKGLRRLDLDRHTLRVWS